MKINVLMGEYRLGCAKKDLGGYLGPLGKFRE
jgi:hypothetical protein